MKLLTTCVIGIFSRLISFPPGICYFIPVTVQPRTTIFHSKHIQIKRQRACCGGQKSGQKTVNVAKRLWLRQFCVHGFTSFFAFCTVFLPNISDTFVFIRVFIFFKSRARILKSMNSKPFKAFQSKNRQTFRKPLVFPTKANSFT